MGQTSKQQQQNILRKCAVWCMYVPMILATYETRVFFLRVFVISIKIQFAVDESTKGRGVVGEVVLFEKVHKIIKIQCLCIVLPKKYKNEMWSLFGFVSITN